MRADEAEEGADEGEGMPLPDLQFGLLHQKLQMLNLCIARQQARRRSKTSLQVIGMKAQASLRMRMRWVDSLSRSLLEPQVFQLKTLGRQRSNAEDMASSTFIMIPYSRMWTSCRLRKLCRTQKMVVSLSFSTCTCLADPRQM